MGRSPSAPQAPRLIAFFTFFSQEEAMPPRFLLSWLVPVSLLTAIPAFAAHTGITRRNGYSWSDAAIFGVVVVALILARRALRRRLRSADRDRRD
jgi:hypothetical protein